MEGKYIETPTGKKTIGIKDTVKRLNQNRIQVGKAALVRRKTHHPLDTLPSYFNLFRVQNVTIPSFPNAKVYRKQLPLSDTICPG
ncbi:hypothetical protein DSO57_1022927 [Entomophthora muscae]|uniref:Uncharacterized protein n=1 Tax=Entomophthora muscae TaxID=34485 RepID=A0ACC2UC16_9FUNG|nr:hypothetical protein DSO57_1022927 [Entomophthora muscae]